MMAQVKCPYCDSIQVKAMANQPKKYPRPTDPIDLANWQKGYDCKKCGNDFVVTPPKPLGFFTKLLGWLFLAIIGFFVYMVIANPSKNDPSTGEKPVSEQVTQQDEVIAPTVEENPLDQEFSQEAEEAAHENIPTEDDYKKHESIQNSVDQNDTLSIKTTLRAKDE